MSRYALALGLWVWPFAVQAHSFGRVYNLPVPFWLYAWGAVAALVASFLVVGLFVGSHSPVQVVARHEIGDMVLFRVLGRLRLLMLAKLFSLSALLLCIATGLWGTDSPYGNFNMTFFWIVFILGFAYFTALAGDLYALINPWQVMAEAIGKMARRYGEGVISYPAGLQYWPAVLFYMAFIWIELMGNTGPHSLAMLLLAYSAINLFGIGLIGRRDWFRYCEFLSLFFRLLARMAPLERQAGRLYLRPPFVGLIESPAANISMLVFVLFMLSSTAFDGLRETVIWYRLFWAELYNWKLSEWAGTNPLAAFPVMNEWYRWWQGFWLLASPFVYLAVYWLFIWLTRLVTGSGHSLRELALQFAYTLLPIALVYNITHYYTLIQTQGVKIISLASDPFGRGWDLFGTAGWLQRTIIPDAGTVWHVQVVLIVLGHIISVYLAHLVALRVFETRRQAVISQLPMLFLMVIFTTAGLWILSQPIKGGVG